MFSSFWFHLAVASVLFALRYVLAVRVRPSSPMMCAYVQEARSLCESASVTLLTLFFLIQPFVAQAYYIPSASMENSLPIGTRILASPLAARVVPITAGEAVVFTPPATAVALSSGEGSAEGDVWIKRCIGAPGHIVEIKKNVLWRDGKVVAEPYAIWSSPGLAPITYDMKIIGDAVYSREYDVVGHAGEWTQANVFVPDQSAITRAAAGKVPEGKFLVLGDHRNDSLDGHIWGFLDQSAVVGRAFVSFWPPQQIGTIGR